MKSINTTKKAVLCTLCFMLLATVLPGQEEGAVVLDNPTSIFYGTENSRVFVNLAAVYGSHRTGVGLEAGALVYAPFPLLGLEAAQIPLEEHVGILGKVNLRYNGMDFGFPGESYLAEAQMKLFWSLGDSNAMFRKYSMINGYGEHTFSFGLNGYLSSDTTSQVTGQLDYSYIADGFALLLNYENDTIFLLQDRYRTAAVRISSLFDLGRDVLGFSLGFNLWAGERKIDLWEIWNNGNIQVPEEVQRGKTVNLYNGKEYSTDVAYVSLVFNNMSLSLGYDSESLKAIIHNTVHYVLNDGNLPIIDRPDRFFIEFKIGMLENLY